MAKTNKEIIVDDTIWECPWCHTRNKRQPYSTHCRRCRFVNYVKPIPPVRLPATDLPWWVK